MDEPSYYGFPTYGEDTVKAAQDCGGPTVTGDERSMVEDAAMRERLAAFMATHLPGAPAPPPAPSAASTRSPPTATSSSPRCPAHEQVVVGLGAAHGFKFAADFGRLLTDLAVDGTTAADVSAFAPRPPGAHRPVLRAQLDGVR